MNADRPDLETTPSAGEPAAAPPPLKRETMVVSSDRGRLAVLVALCSLAGVAVGFGLSNMAHSLRPSCAHMHMYRHVGPVQAERTWLGVHIVDNRAMTWDADCRDGIGASVEKVVAGSPADRAGVMAGDVIVGFEHRAVSSAEDLVRKVRTAHAGDRAQVVVRRGEQRLVLMPRLGSMPAEYFERY